MPIFFTSLIAALLLIAQIPAVPAHAVEPAVAQAEQQRIEVMARAASTVVAVFGAEGAGGGSGVLITPDGYALTNFHVVQGAGNFMKCGLADGILYDAVIVSIDPTGDVALIKLLGRDDFPAAPMGNSDLLHQGDPVFAMGNPFLLATDFHPTATFGIVSGIHRYQYPSGTILEYTDCIQTDASINPGNSGGPLFNMAGEVVGINGRISLDKRGRVNVGAGYAISINQIKHFMDHLRSGRIVDHATLGAIVSTNQDGAVMVDNILEETPVYRRGLRLDDEIVSFAGRPIRSVNQFKNILGIYPKGWKLPLAFRREVDGNIETHEIIVRLEALHRSSELTLDKPAKKPRGPQLPKNERKEPRPDPAKTSPELAKYYQKKPGFLNYYFNELERDRALRGLADLGDFSETSSRWIVTGKTETSEDFRIVFASTGMGMLLGENAYLQPLGEDAATIDEPPGSGGLLAGLNHYRRLLTMGAAGFSEFYYVGSTPLDGVGERVDIVEAELNAGRSLWYFHKGTGELMGFDFWIHDQADPCEVRFSGRRDFQGRILPARWTVNHADKTFVTLNIENCEFPTSDDETVKEVGR
ncbi:Periplasmic serine endoprotease DegP precursor [Symmachiella dynata]|uniref:Periplasmic serine endoprotease DegP n=1 Tax=Symmachiella dynata TaxID=2527995 RepID=A0A517ZSB0_9PLAN|nr:trypsin-like peptidase domain-containing protein [Symmachiella dynata]QDU45392.1 Periplasmic serine endoprotease DegP precursor [Symmachiella dynata]